MRCQDIMRKPVQVCHDYDDVQAVACKMADCNIGFVPVCDEHGRLVGVLTDRDIAIRVAAEDRTASDTRVGDVMSPGVIACRPWDELSRVEELMAKHHKSRIVITDADGVLAGVVSLTDLAEHDEAHALPTARAEILRP